MRKLTKSQREWLNKIATEGWTVGDIASGGTPQLITRLKNMGLISVGKHSNWMLQPYLITDAGREALALPRAELGTGGGK